MLKNKLQITNIKSQINSNIQYPIFQAKGFWSLVIYLLVIICNLVFGAWNFSVFAEDVFTYDAKAKRNPFIALVTSEGRLLQLDREEESKQELMLEGIIYDKNGMSYAIVNATVVRIGDEVNGYQILKIERNKVIFIKDGEPTEIILTKEGE